MTHLVMFDIDGTLVDSVEFDGQFFAEAIRDVLGVVVDRDWSTYPHVTDGGLLEEVMRRHGVADPDGVRHAAVKRRFVERVREYVLGEPDAVREVPGAAALLRTLRDRADCRVAIATGGWRDTALLKLAAAGFDLDGSAMATSCDAHSRVDIMRIAEQRATVGLIPTRRTYFGDGAWDQRACAELGWRFVAIGGALRHQPSFRCYSDAPEVMACLGL
jgi:FMN phosphatase YigB (HAD superfamily)